MSSYRMIGIYELITGIFGIILISLNISWIIDHKENVNVFISGIVLFLGSVAAGYALLKGYQNAVKYSVLVQILQSFSFVISGYQYLYTSGAFICVIFNNTGIHFKSKVLPIDYLISKVSPLLQTEIKIYILPIVFLAILLFQMKKESSLKTQN